MYLWDFQAMTKVAFHWSMSQTEWLFLVSLDPKQDTNEKAWCFEGPSRVTINLHLCGLSTTMDIQPNAAIRNTWENPQEFPAAPSDSKGYDE